MKKINVILLMLLADTLIANTLTIWQASDSCDAKPSGSYHYCSPIPEPGRILTAFPKPTNSDHHFIKNLDYHLVVSYHYLCKGRSDQTYLSLDGSKKPLKFGSKEELVFPFRKGSDESLRLIRQSRSFSTVSSHCRIGIENQYIFPANVKALHLYTYSLKNTDTLLASLVTAATPGSAFHATKANIESSKSILSFQLLTATNKLAKAMIQSSIDQLDSSLKYLSQSCGEDSTTNCSPELIDVRRILSAQIEKIDGEIHQIKSYVESEMIRLEDIGEPDVNDRFKNQLVSAKSELETLGSLLNIEVE